MEKYGDHFNIGVLVAVSNCTSIIGVYSVVIIFMANYEDHFNIGVLVAVANCTSIKGVYSVVIDHFFPSTGMC